MFAWKVSKAESLQLVLRPWFEPYTKLKLMELTHYSRRLGLDDMALQTILQRINSIVQVGNTSLISVTIIKT
jgi:hypothetical protein